MTTPLDRVRAKIIEAVPEIVELKFGCVVMVDLGYRKQEGMITRWLDTSRNMLQWIEWPYLASGRVNEWCTDKSKMEIIGRPITLEDVLLALYKFGPPYIAIDNMGYFIGAIGGSVDGDYTWHFGKPLHEQSPETIEFLDRILG